MKYPKNDISWPRKDYFHIKSVIFQEEMPHDFSQNTDFPAAYRGKDHLEKPRDSRSPGGGGASGGMVAHDLVNGWQATA